MPDRVHLIWTKLSIITGPLGIEPNRAMQWTPAKTKPSGAAVSAAVALPSLSIGQPIKSGTFGLGVESPALYRLWQSVLAEEPWWPTRGYRVRRQEHVLRITGFYKHLRRFNIAFPITVIEASHPRRHLLISHL